MILVAVSSREDTALIEAKQRPPHTDPFAFDGRLQVMTSQLNVGFVDSVKEFAREQPQTVTSTTLTYIPMQMVTPSSRER